MVLVRSVLLALMTAVTLHAAQWEKITEQLKQVMPEEDQRGKQGRGVGFVFVTPGNGRVYAAMNFHGVYQSDDHGETWQRSDDGSATGRYYGGISLHQQTDRFAVFGVGRKANGCMSLDGGASWQAFTNPAGDDFSWGMVDWSQVKPTRILAKQHHTPGVLWYSQDAGQQWQKLKPTCRRLGLAAGGVLLLGSDEGIQRSTDQGQSWDTVSLVQVLGPFPTRYQDQLYWPAVDGVYVSKDEGASWIRYGSELEGCVWGPYFDGSSKRCFVVSKAGIHFTDNSGVDWAFISPDPSEVYVPDHPANGYGWDPQARILYASAMWREIYRLRLE